MNRIQAQLVAGKIVPPKIRSAASTAQAVRRRSPRHSDDALGGHGRDLLLGVAGLGQAPRPVCAPSAGGGEAYAGRSPSTENAGPSVVKSPSRWRIPIASSCGSAATSPTSCTGAAGTPPRRASPARPRACPREAAPRAPRRAPAGSPRGPGSSRTAGRRRAPAAPIASASRRKSPSFAAVIISPPSAAGKTWYGAIAWNAVPCGVGTAPVSIVADQVVGDERERGLPERDVERARRRPACSAARIANAAYIPVVWSISETPTRTPVAARLARHARSRRRRPGAAGRSRAGRASARCVRRTRSCSRRARASAPAASSAPRPSSVGEPGPQALDEDVGAVDEAQHHLAAAAQVERERALPRVRRRRTALPARRRTAAPSSRASSPDGGSTLITSAPSEPRSCVQVGPAYEVVTSTTRTPARGANDMAAIIVSG